MSGISRRNILISGGALAGLAACGNGIGGNGAAKLDARVDAARDYLRTNFPGAAETMSKAVGILYVPLVTEAGLFFGGAYGRGALRINDVTVDYYSATQASYGIQIGAQQYAHALMFMTQESLANFRASDGWAAGADLEYALPDRGGSAGVETTTTLAPVIAYVYGQAGFIAGATVKGTKYTRIIP
ncbi:MAG: twin-arginine translocation pathway signal [Rhodobacteraceae bacterium]|nr:twin-arginine translocation pathway signal [Paracoccaceae bacterium]